MENGSKIRPSVLQKFQHDLKNPLSVIAGNTQLIRVLAAGSAEEKAILDSVADVETACEMMKELIDHLSSSKE